MNQQFHLSRVNRVLSRLCAETALWHYRWEDGSLCLEILNGAMIIHCRPHVIIQDEPPALCADMVWLTEDMSEEDVFGVFKRLIDRALCIREADIQCSEALGVLLDARRAGRR